MFNQPKTSVQETNIDATLSCAFTAQVTSHKKEQVLLQTTNECATDLVNSLIIYNICQKTYYTANFESKFYHNSTLSGNKTGIY
jgi:hypothetical protein